MQHDEKTFLSLSSPPFGCEFTEAQPHQLKYVYSLATFESPVWPIPWFVKDAVEGYSTLACRGMRVLKMLLPRHAPPSSPYCHTLDGVCACVCGVCARAPVVYWVCGVWCVVPVCACIGACACKGVPSNVPRNWQCVGNSIGEEKWQGGGRGMERKLHNPNIQFNYPC